MRYSAVNSIRRSRRKFLCFSGSKHSVVLTEATESSTHLSSAKCAFKRSIKSTNIERNTKKLLDCMYLTVWRTGHTHTLAVSRFAQIAWFSKRGKKFLN